jgi:hypothetical protein
MADVYPMRPLGAADDSAELLGYTPRDPIGVEDQAANPADSSGWNEGAKWTGRVESAFELEHTDEGLHRTLKIARGVARVLCDRTTSPPTYGVAGESYLRNDDGDILEGSLAFTAVRTSQGVVTLTLGGGGAFDLPSTDARIVSLGSRGHISRAPPEASTWQTVRLDSVAAVNQIVVRIYKNDAISDENFTILIHDA